LSSRPGCHVLHVTAGHDDSMGCRGDGYGTRGLAADALSARRSFDGHHGVFGLHAHEELVARLAIARCSWYYESTLPQDDGMVLTCCSDGKRAASTLYKITRSLTGRGIYLARGPSSACVFPQKNSTSAVDRGRGLGKQGRHEPFSQCVSLPFDPPRQGRLVRWSRPQTIV
jgi:hypothetical protein